MQSFFFIYFASDHNSVDDNKEKIRLIGFPLGANP